MFVYKKLKASDAGITAFEAHKEYTAGEVYFGRYSSASKDTYSLFNLNNELEYFQLDHLFYKNPIFKIGDLNGGINYIDQEKRLYEKAAIISISQDKFGNSIQKGTVNVDSTYIDDSKGNLYNSNTNLDNYPTDKERVLYLGPVKGFKKTDLTRNLTSGELLINVPTSYNAKDIDDSLYINPVQYISCSVEHFSDINCTGVQLENGYLKVPHSNNYNFGDSDFSITFYYKTTDASQTKYLVSKGGTQTVVKSPGYNTDGSIKGTKPPTYKPTDYYSLQSSEEDAGKAFPFEIILNNNKINFSRADQNITSTATGSNLADNTLYHISCIKTGSDLQVYINGDLTGSNTDNTDLCKNQADLFIGANSNISQNKLDSTSEGLISQLMVWNRGLSETEISNVSESIDGTPYVGNVFYENGIITFTSPKVNSDFATVTSTTNPFSLLPTSWVEGTTTTQNVIFNTFTGSFTFFNEETGSYYPDSFLVFLGKFGADDQTIFFPNGYEVETKAIEWANGTPPPTIGIMSTINKVILGASSGLTINPITSSTFDNYNTHSDLIGISSGISGSIGTSSGDLGTDGDSTTLMNNPLNVGYLGFYLGENQTVTESINILFATNSQEIITENFPAGFTTIDDTIFSINDSIYTGVNYKNLFLDPGFYIYTNTPSGFEEYPWYSGSMSQNSSTTIADQNEGDREQFNTINYTVPAGTTAGANYEKTTTFGLGPGIVEILEEPEDGFSYSNPLYVRVGYSGSLGVTPSIGDTFTTKIRFYFNGSLYYTKNINGFSSLDLDGYELTQQFPVDPLDPAPSVGDKISISFEFEWDGPTDSSFPSADSEYTVYHFGIYQDPNKTPYQNYLESRTTIDTKLSSIYNITCSKISPNGINPASDHGYDSSWVNNSNNGLNTDINGDTLGVKALLWNRYNSTGNYTLITQSFYPSSSYATALTNNFHYSYGPTDSENDEELFFQIVADTAENTIPNGFTVSSLNSLTSGDYPIAKLPSSASMGISGSFTVTEISGSNILVLNSGLSNKFTSSENVSSVVEFNDTSNLIGNTSSPTNIVGFVGDDPTKLQVEDAYFVTSSFNATASLDRGNYISGSSSINLTIDDPGIYFVERLVVRTPTFGTTEPYGLSTGQKVKIDTKIDGTVVDTRYIEHPAYIGNVFSPYTPYELGALSSSNSCSFEFTVVDSSNQPDTVTKGEGFAISNLVLRRITSSNEITLQGGGEFPFADDIDLFNISPTYGGILGGPYQPSLRFRPNVAQDGINEVLYGVTFNEDNDTAILDQFLFITQSITLADYVDFRKNGPFVPLVEWEAFDYESGKEYNIAVSGTLDSGGSPSNPVDGIGPAIRLLDNNGIILNETFIDSGTNVLETTKNLDINSIRFDNNGTLKVQLFISGASTSLYPDGIISSSLTASWEDTPQIIVRVRSGSTISSGDTVTNFTVISGSEDWIYNWTGEGINGEYTASQTSNTNIASVTGSQVIYSGIAPELNNGNFTIAPVLNGSNLEVGTPLFITESVVISGSAPSTIEVLDDVYAVPINPFIVSSSTNPDDDVKEEWLGYTFEYTNPIGNEIETLTVTSINTDDNSITVNNGQGLFQVGTYDAQNKQDTSVTYNTTTTSGGSVNFKNTHLIFENEFHCTVEEDEFNFTLNPTARKNKSINNGDLANFATGSNFKPYVTTIGLYNEEGELLVVGKMAQPIRMSEETDTTFVVRFDT